MKDVDRSNLDWAARTIPKLDSKIAALEADNARLRAELDALRGSARLVVNTVGNMTQAQLGHEGYAAVCGLLNVLDEQCAVGA